MYVYMHTDLYLCFAYIEAINPQAAGISRCWASFALGSGWGAKVVANHTMYWAMGPWGYGAMGLWGHG